MSHDHSTHSHHNTLHAVGIGKAMAIGVCLNSIFVVLEAVCGWYADSLGLMADAGHNAGDVVGLLLAWGADAIARRPSTPRYTWGLRRTTIFAALANAILLLAACCAIVWEAYRRLWFPEPTEGMIMIVVATVGVVINGFTAILLMKESHADLNIRGAYLHMMADAAVSLGVVVAGVALWTTGILWIDPIVSMLVSFVVAYGTWGLLWESANLALDAVPRGIDFHKIDVFLRSIEGVSNVHELRIWGPSTSESSLTAHVVVVDERHHRRVLSHATECLKNEHGIKHITLQIEDKKVSETVSE